MSVCDPTTPVEYREIPEVPGYRFGSDGSAWSRCRGPSKAGRLWHRLNPMTNDTGHQRLNVSIAGAKRRSVGLNYLIAWAFHGPCPPGMKCQYRDHDASNNCPSNLFWGRGPEPIERTSKPCTKCGIVKPLEHFWAIARNPDGRHERCNGCAKDDRIAFLSRPEARGRVRDVEIRSKIKYRYGISIEEFSRMLTLQGGVCAICGEPPMGGRKTKRLHVDHDHDTGAIRGLLCHRCNTALGQFGDSLEGVMKVVEYLKRSRD